MARISHYSQHFLKQIDLHLQEMLGLKMFEGGHYGTSRSRIR